MFRLVLGQMRGTLGRLVAAGIAVALGTGFVAATLLGTDAITQATRSALTTTFGDARVIVEPMSDVPLAPKIAAVPGIESVHASATTGITVTSGDRAEYILAAPRPDHPALEIGEVARGALPTKQGEVALSASTISRLKTDVGETVSVSVETGDGSTGSASTVTVVGELKDLTGLYYSLPFSVVSGDQFAAWATPDVLAWAPLLVLPSPGTDERALTSALADAVGSEGQVEHIDDYADRRLLEYTGDVNVLTGFVLAFAAVALFVAAIVIANTFQVVVAQRTRILALLRCVGATRGQVRRSILLEAGLLGVVASLAGITLGAVALQVLLIVLQGQALDVPLPATIQLSLSSVLWPLAIGVLVTLGAALAPAGAATRVAPVAALRPLETPRVRRGSTARAASAIVLLVLGLWLIALGVVIAQASGESDPTLPVLIAVMGGVISFTGVLIGALFVVPPTARLLGRGSAALGGVPGQLATANSVRNPRRTTATATAIVIGTALITLMATGASSARVTLASTLNAWMPVDLVVASYPGYEMAEDGTTTLTQAGLVPDQIEAVAGAPGVTSTLQVTGTVVDLGVADRAEMSNSGMTLYGLDPEMPEVARGTDMPTQIADDELLIDWGFQDGDVVTLTSALSGAEPIDLTVRRVDRLPGGEMFVSPATLDRIDPDPRVLALWARVSNPDDPLATVDGIRSSIAELSSVVTSAHPTFDPAPQVSGAVVERAGFQQVIDTVLAVILGLLAVAVVIALIGVANTLSLSVIERRRESATLRALGLTKRQLQRSLAIEGIMLATVGALLGILTGLVYGVAGSMIVLASLNHLTIALPWTTIGVVFLVAVVAGLLASVLPSRTAVKTSPVAALAVD